MEKIIPYFEVDGITYEIKRTRYLLVELKKAQNRKDYTQKEQATATYAASIVSDVKKYAEKTKELEEKYFETFDEEDRRKYLAMKELYTKALLEMTNLEVETNIIDTANKKMLDMYEEIAVKGLAEQYFDMNLEKGKELWEKYVDSVGTKEASEWLMYMYECLFTKDESEVDGNSFLSKMRARKTAQ